MASVSRPGSAGEVFRVALGLGMTSFGGPVAHLAYFRRTYVERRRWLDEAAYADLVALCQSLPGPASSQLGIAIGARRAGFLGGLAAWLGFTAPSALALIGFGLIASSTDLAGAGWVHGLKLAAVAVVAQAVVAMARTLTPDLPRRIGALLAAVGALALGGPYAQVGIIALGAVLGRLVLAPPPAPSHGEESRTIAPRLGVASLAAFFGLLIALPLLARSGWHPMELFSAFYRSGALVFGGGHVVLPLLHAAVVVPGWVPPDAFLAGYGAAQAMPGPLFSVAAYLGTIAGGGAGPDRILGALLCLIAIYLPSFLLLFGVLPFWERLRGSAGFRRALAGTNAAVVGLLAAALVTPVATGAILSLADLAVTGVAFAAVLSRRVPVVAIVAATALVGQLLSAVLV